MEEFIANTNAIRENIKILQKYSNYYAKKKETFKKNAYGSSNCTPISNYLQKINQIYDNLAKNTDNVIKYLEQYVNDIENVEQVMSNTGSGNINASNTRAHANKYRNYLKKYNIPDEDIFPINNFNASSYSGSSSSIAVNVDNPFARVNSSQNVNVGKATAGFNTAVFGFDHIKREGYSAEYQEISLSEYESWMEKINSGDMSSFSLDKLGFSKVLDGYIVTLQNQTNLFQPLLDDAIKKSEARNELESRYSEIEDWQNQYEVNLRERAGQYRQGIISKEKIKELGLDKYTFDQNTYTYDLTIDEMVDLIKSKDLETKNFYRELEQTMKELNTDTERLTGYATYAEFASNFDKIEQDQYIASATLKKLENQIAMASYTLLPFLEEYQNYKNSDNIKTPLEKVGVFSSEKIKNLAEAIEINEDYAEMGNIYNYIYETEGEYAANEYLNAVEDSVNQILGQKKANEFLESLSGETKTIINENGEEETIRVFSDSALTSISDHLKITGKGIGEGVQSFGEGLAAWLKSSDVYSADEYERMYILDALSKGENSFLYSNNFEISQSIGNMAPTIALSIILGSTGVGEAYAAGAAGAAMGTSAGGNSYHQALVEGYSQGQSLLYGALNGLSEAGLEMVIGGLTGISDVKVTNFLTYLQASAKEGNEEALQEIIDALSRKAIFGEDIEWSDTFKAALKSGAYGAITADVLNGASLTVNAGISGINSYFNSNVNGFSQIVNAKNMISERYKNLHQEQLNAIKDGTINKIKGMPNQVKETAQKYANNFNEFREHLNNKVENDVNNSVDRLTIEDLNYNTNNGKLTNLGNVLLSNLKKYVYTNTNKFNGLNEKIQEEGLYHFADENTIDKIFDSQTIKASGLNASYGTPKSFFFAGVPSVGAYATNLDSIPLTTTAVKVVPTDNSINSSKFKVRNLDDAAISYNGNFDLNNAISTKEYFALKLENNELIYQKVSKEEYENYANTEEGQKIADFLKDKKNIQAIKNDYFNKLAQKLDRGHLLNELNETIETLDVDNVADNNIKNIGKKAKNVAVRGTKTVGGFTGVLAAQALNALGPIGTMASIPLTLKGISLIQDGVFNNNINNSFLMTEDRIVKTENGYEKISKLYQNAFAFNDFIKSRFSDNPQEYFLVRSLNAFQQLNKNQKYATTSQANTYMLLRQIQKLGFIKNLTKTESKKQSNLAFERFYLGVKQRERAIKMYDLSFETTDKTLDSATISDILKLSKVDLSKYDIKTDSKGNTILDLRINEKIKEKFNPMLYIDKIKEKLHKNNIETDITNNNPENIEILETDNVADNTVEKVEEINTNTTNNISEEAKQAFEKLQMFFDTDLKVKEIMSENAPNAAYQYNQEYISQYSDNLLEMIKDLKFYFKKMSKVINISDTYINDLFNNYEIQLAECGLNFNKLKKFYNDYISDMSDNIINLTRENFAGYSLDAKEAFSSVLSEAKTVNEVLHVLHSYITNDNDMYTSMPTIDSKTNSNQESITLYGEDNEIARSFFNSFPTNEDSNITDIISLKNKLLVMVRDRGHALTIEINYDENGKAYIDYFIPKICNADKVNKLTGVRKVSSDAPANAFTTGYFETTLDNLNNDIYNFIKNVPTDDDMVFPEFDEINAPAENDISQVSENSTESTMERVKLSNEKYIFADDFINLSTEKQIDYITSANRYQLNSILRDINLSNIDSKVVNEIQSKIINNQDVYFNTDKYSRNTFSELILSNPELAQKVKNVILIQCIDHNDNSSSYAMEELYRRINNGENILDHQVYTTPHFNLYENSLNKFIAQYPDAWDKIRNILKNKFDSLSPEIKDISRQSRNLYAQGYFIEEYLKGNIDEEGLNFINELVAENPKKAENINYSLLNKKYIDTLGVDYLKSIINDYSCSNQLVTLNENYPNLYNSFVDILNNAQKDNSLYTLSIKMKNVLNYLYNNADKFNELNSNIITSENFVNFAIYMNKDPDIKIYEYYDDYENELNNKCDEKFKEAYNDYKKYGSSYKLNELKNLYFTKFCNLPYDNVKDLINKYSENIEFIQQNEPYSATILEYLKYIDSLNDIDLIKDIYMNQTFKLTSEEMLYLDDSLRKAYVATYIESLGKTANTINQTIDENSSLVETIDYNGKEIKMVSLNDDFALIARSSESGLLNKNRALVDDSYIKTWNNTNGAHHLLATSYITSENIGSCPVNGTGVLYGFTNIKEDDLMMMGPADIHSEVNNVGYESVQSQKFITADKMSSYTTRIYNELVLEKANVKPDCIIVYTDFSPELMNNAYKAAAEWNIPIIKIDKTQLAENNNQKINNHLSEFSQTKNLEELESALNLYESNVSGFKLNTYVEEGKTDVTSSIDNSYIKELGLFDSKQIETNLQQALEYYKTLDNNSEMVDNYIEILKQVQYKYDITNSMRNSALANSKSDIDYNAYIEEALKIRK